ncbi:amine oxidase [Mycena galopus ATCC 62051]|nr:amine oxidase [Mycena galopus ATCC 62051]
MQRIAQLLLAVITASVALAASTPEVNGTTSTSIKNDKTVLILGGGVASIIAARTLAKEGITDFLIVEARDELGGRMHSKEARRRATGTQEGDGPANPILTFARKHGVKTAESDFYESVVTYDETGKIDYLDILNNAVDAYTNLTVVGGGRVPTRQVDTTCRTGYSLVGAKPKTPQEMVTEYYVDWEYAQTPEQTSWIASSWANNFTFDVDQGGFSDDNLLSVDQRGFKYLIQAEARTFLKPEQFLLNATVRTIAHSGDGVIVTLANGTRISGDYAISTFSLGVLQNADVLFESALPMWKQEAIQSMTMFALYADKERGRYPVWQGLDLEGFLPGSGIIFATVTGDYSERIEALSDAQVQAELLDVLHTMFPNTTIPAPTAFFFPRWFSDPLYRGSYSNWPASFVSQHHTNLRANVGKRLWFSGEAMSQKYFGFLHGAYFEGMDAGERVANCVLSGGHCKSLPFVEFVLKASPYII